MSVEEIIINHLHLWTDAVTHKTGTGRGISGKSGKMELTGIKKLRELILELAVRGKLVEQDPTDEPANVLLDHITEEKARLVKEGTIKKLKKLPEITEEEKPFVLPETWSWIRLGNISQINPRNDADDDLQASFIPMPLISTSHNGEHLQERRSWGEIKKGYTHFADGDIAIAKITPCFENSKAAVFNSLKNGIGAGTTELHVARPFRKTLNPRYVLLCLKSPRFLNKGEKNMTGSAGQKRVPKDFFAGEPLPLPPLQEQHRIVKKVDELMTLCNRLEHQVGNKLKDHEVLVETLLDTLSCSEDPADLANNWARVADQFDILFTTTSSIYKLKQTILQLAVMGRLEPQDPKDEPASALLKNIEDEKNWLVKKGEIKKPKPLPSLKPEEEPYELPQGWEWTRLGNLAVSNDSGWSPQCLPEEREDGHWGVLKVSAVSWGHFNPKENKALPNNKAPRLECAIKKGDFLISRANTNDLVARSVIVEDTHEKLMMSDKIVRFEFSRHVNKHFVNIANGTSFSRSYYTKNASGTSSSMKNVSRQVMAELPIPLPPLAEQQRIVTKTNQLESIFNDLEEKIVAASAKKDNLLNTVMEKVLGEACA